MKRQKSFEEEIPSLYLVATPIGNLSEMSERAIEVLKKVDVIACEDTRTSAKLLQHFGITTKTIAHHKYNEKVSSDGIIRLLEDGKNVALISDAGYPLISDPGYVLCQDVIAAGFHTIPISGSNAMLGALVASGLSTQHFLFYGFIESKDGKARKELDALKNFPYTLIFYEAPHRLNKTLKLMLEVLGNRIICIARELTKKHEEFIRCSLEEALLIEDLKGEIVLVVEGYRQEEMELSKEDVVSEIEYKIKSGLTPRDAIKAYAKEYDVSKNKVYELYLEGRND